MQRRHNGRRDLHTACQDFYYGRCYNPICPFSHTIIDTTRLIRIVKALNTRASPTVRLLFQYSIAPAAATPSSTIQGGEWRLHLKGGHLSYFMKGNSAIEVFKATEDRYCGPSLPTTDFSNSSHTICLNYFNNRCSKGSRCRNRHDLFDTARVEALSRKLLQSSPSSRSVDSDVSLAYTHDGNSGQWEIDFRLWQGSSYIKQVITDSNLRAAMNVAEQSVLATRGRPATGSTDHTSGYDSAIRRSDESPPSYAAATATHLPSYHAIVNAASRPLLERLARPTSTGSALYALPGNHAFTSFSVSSTPHPNPIPSSHYPRTVHSTIIYPTHVHDSALPSERQPLLPQRPDIQITYNSINNPARVRIGESSSSSSWDHNSEDGEGTPLVVQFMGLVTLTAISWVIIVVITLPCSEATC